MSFSLCYVRSIPQLAALLLLFYHYCCIIVCFILLALRLSVKGQFCPVPVEEQDDGCGTSTSSTLCSAPHTDPGTLTLGRTGEQQQSSGKGRGRAATEHAEHRVRLLSAWCQTKVESINEIKSCTSEKSQQKMLC